MVGDIRREGLGVCAAASETVHAPEDPAEESEARSRSIARAIVEEMARRAEHGFDGDISLARGLSGSALLFAYAHRAFPEGGYDILALRVRDAIIEGIERAPLMPSLFTGIAGAAWSVMHVNAALGGEADGDLTAEVDGYLREVLTVSPWRSFVDLVSGLAGLGVYALATPRSATRSALIGLVLDRLEETAVRGTAGIAWLTAPELLVDYQKKRHPTGHYNLGLAHGISGVIVFLARCVRADEHAVRACRLLDGAVPWLIHQARPTPWVSRFPYCAGEEDEARLAWCYGDSGIAQALLLAGTACGQQGWTHEGEETALRAVTRARETTKIVDAHLCHGASGLYRIADRMAQLTGDPRHAQAARRWLREILDYHGDGRGIAGYSHYWPKIDRWTGETGWLLGVCGIGLALLAASDRQCQDWDEPLLVSL